MSRLIAIALEILMVLLVGTRLSAAEEIRVVDAGGLVRAVKVVRGNTRIVVTLNSPTAGECVATNVDGLAVERRVSVSPRGECVFADVAVGSWQVQVPGNVGWRVRIYE
jgi:hypothetical protein